jgi:hypothetical protein
VFAELEITTRREGNLVLFSEKPFDTAALRRTGSPRFVADERVRAARALFARDGAVYFVDVAGMIEALPRLIKTLDGLGAATSSAAASSSKTTSPPPSIGSMVSPVMLAGIQQALRDNLPSAMAAGAGFEGGDYVAKSLIMPVRPDQSLGLTPLIPLPVTGPALRMRVPEMLPGDVTVAASVSLDFEKSYDKALDLYHAFNRLRNVAGPPPTTAGTAAAPSAGDDPSALEAQIGAAEEGLGFKIRDELLASFGHEVGFVIKVESFPWEQRLLGTGDVAAAVAATTAEAGAEEKQNPGSSSSSRAYSLAFLLEVKDRQKLEKLLPQVLGAVGGLAGVAASSPATSVSSSGAADAPAAADGRTQVAPVIHTNGKVFYAFVGDFLVVSDGPAMINRIAEAKAQGPGRGVLGGNPDYLTAVGDGEAYAHLYVARDVMRSLDAAYQKSLNGVEKKGKTTATATASLEAKVIGALAGSSREARPISYRMTPERGAGVYHEMRIPVGLYTLFVAYALTEAERAKSVAATTKGGGAAATSNTTRPTGRTGKRMRRS